MSCREATNYLDEKGRHLSQAELHEAHQKLRQEIANFGSAIDKQIYDIYMKILKQTSGHGNHYIKWQYKESSSGFAPKSTRFFAENWSVEGLRRYLFDSPSTLSFVKKEDLKFLLHVLVTAKGMPYQSELRDVIKVAENSWALKELETLPSLRRQFVSYQDKQSNSSRNGPVLIAAGEIASEKGKSFSQNSKFIAAYLSFQNASTYDAFLMRLYLEVVRRFSVDVSAKTNSNIRPTDWAVFENQLRLGAVEDVVDFIHQNSFDIPIKSYFSLIMNEMLRSSSPQDRNLNFSKAFDLARAAIDSRIVKHPVPINQGTNLLIFTKSQLISVMWNSFLGRLDSSLVGQTNNKGKNILVGDVPLLRVAIENYFATLVRRNTYTKEEASSNMAIELKASLARSAFFTFNYLGKVVAMARVFDGSGGQKLYIENKFPDLEIPERSLGIPVYELGRIMTSEEVEANSLPMLLARVADYFENSNLKGVLYFDCSPVAARYYKRLGAEVVQSPEVDSQGSPLFIMKMSVDLLVSKFGQGSEFGGLALREGASMPEPKRATWWDQLVSAIRNAVPSP